MAKCVSGSKWAQSTELDMVTMQFMRVGSLDGVTYLRYTALMSLNKDETAVHCCDPALSVLLLFGVSKRLSRGISLAFYCLDTQIYLDFLIPVHICEYFAVTK